MTKTEKKIAVLTQRFDRYLSRIHMPGTEGYKYKISKKAANEFDSIRAALDKILKGHG